MLAQLCHALAVCSTSIALFGPWLLPPGGTRTHTWHACWGFLLLCRSLFEKDKLLFSFSLAFKLKLDQGLISQQELRFLMTGAARNTRLEHLHQLFRASCCSAVTLMRA